MDLSEIFGEENYLYESDKPIDEFRSEIEALFQRTKGFNFDVNLIGAFDDDNTFHMTPKWSLAASSQGMGDRDVSHLYGELYQKDNKTLVRVAVRPNTGIVVATFLAPAIAIGVLLFGSPNQQGMIIASILAVAAPAWLYFAGIRYPKKAIRNRFAKVFDLRLAADEQLDLPDTNP